MKLDALYTRDDLRYRPLEHVLEAHSCRELGEFLECDKSWAIYIKPGEVQLEDERVRRLRGELGLYCPRCGWWPGWRRERKM